MLETRWIHPEYVMMKRIYEKFMARMEHKAESRFKEEMRRQKNLAQLQEQRKKKLLSEE